MKTFHSLCFSGLQVRESRRFNMARELRWQFRPVICKTFLWFDQYSDSWRSFGKKEKWGQARCARLSGALSFNHAYIKVVRLSVCLSVCLPVSLSPCLCVCLDWLSWLSDMARELRGQFRPVIYKTRLWFYQYSDSWRALAKTGVVCLCVFLSVCLSVCFFRSACLSVSHPVSQSVCLSACLSGLTVCFFSVWCVRDGSIHSHSGPVSAPRLPQWLFPWYTRPYCGHRGQRLLAQMLWGRIRQSKLCSSFWVFKELFMH